MMITTATLTTTMTATMMATTTTTTTAASTATTATVAMAAAAGCQHGLETQHVSSRGYVFIYFYYTNFFFRSTQA